MIWYATSSYASPIHGSKIPGTFNVFTGDIEEYSKESKKFVGFRLTKIRPPRRFSYRLSMPQMVSWPAYLEPLNDEVFRRVHDLVCHILIRQPYSWF